jgi:uncharacterized membrane protein YccC
LGDLYQELSLAAASRVEASQAPPATVQTTQAHRFLATLNRSRTIQGERYVSLLNQAERIRLSLLMLSRLRARLQREDAATPHIDALDTSFRSASHMLRSIGRSLVTGTAAEARPEFLQQLENAAESLRSVTAPGSTAATQAAAARFQLDALAGQLRSAADLATNSSPIGRIAFERREARQPWTLRLLGTFATLRANLSLQSAACRHAIRLAICVALGQMAAGALGTGRSYWLPMTVVIVLKPDFTATLSRGLLRVAGTAIGLVAATVLFEILPSTVLTELIMVCVLTFVLRGFGPANYGFFVVLVSAFVVVLFALTGIAPGEVIAERGINTAVGGLLAVGAYVVWPTWERTQISEAWARMLDAYRNYFHAIRQSSTEPEASFAQEVDRARMAGRLARSNLEASIERLSSEPGVTASDIGTMTTMLASSHRVAHAMMAIETGLTHGSPVAASPEFRRFANHVELTLHSLAAALRGSRLRLSDLPDLREDHRALAHSENPGVRYDLVNIESDRVTNSLNTLTEQLLDWMAKRAARARRSAATPAHV